MQTEFYSDNLSDLIVQIYQEFAKPGITEIPGLSITINGFSEDGSVYEDDSIRSNIDNALERHNLQPIRSVANTIFPLNLWNPSLGRNKLFERYKRIRPKLKTCVDNKEGLYFERMIDFDNSLNQLNEVIKIFQNGYTRRSALQVSIWDPRRDLKNVPYSRFPCLQHVVFQCVKERLIVVGFYATQYVFERAYGNYLGLCYLGKFMAHELKIPLTQVKCYIGVELFDSKHLTKTAFKKIIRSI